MQFRVCKRGEIKYLVKRKTISLLVWNLATDVRLTLALLMMWSLSHLHKRKFLPAITVQILVTLSAEVAETKMQKRKTDESEQYPIVNWGPICQERPCSVFLEIME